MATFQKIETVEARKYEGPRITVVSDQFGEQVATSGDYLIGTERGKVHVIPAATFEAEFSPYTPTPEAEQLAAQKALSAELQQKFDSLDQSNAHWVAENDKAQAMIASLQAQIADQTETKAELTRVKEENSALNADFEALTARHEALLAAEKARAEAEAAAEQAAAKVSSSLG